MSDMAPTRGQDPDDPKYRCRMCNASPRTCEEMLQARFRRGREGPCCSVCRHTDTHGGFDFAAFHRNEAPVEPPDVVTQSLAEVAKLLDQEMALLESHVAGTRLMAAWGMLQISRTALDEALNLLQQETPPRTKG